MVIALGSKRTYKKFIFRFSCYFHPKSDRGKKYSHSVFFEINLAKRGFYSAMLDFIQVRSHVQVIETQHVNLILLLGRGGGGGVPLVACWNTKCLSISNISLISSGSSPRFSSRTTSITRTYPLYILYILLLICRDATKTLPRPRMN